MEHFFFCEGRGMKIRETIDNFFRGKGEGRYISKRYYCEGTQSCFTTFSRVFPVKIENKNNSKKKKTL